jgi:hypothetical protein
MNYWNLIGRKYLGGGWYVWHQTDRNIELRKDDVIYRKLTGKDGYVKMGAEPGMSREQLEERALTRAIQNDEKAAMLVAQEIIPRASQLQTYEMKAHQLNKVFKTPESPTIIGRKKV